MNKYDELINRNKIVVLYFEGSTCGACEVIKRKILTILDEYKEVRLKVINGLEEKEISAQYNVFSLPITILFINGKETIRFGRYVDMMEFKSMLSRYYSLIYN